MDGTVKIFFFPTMFTRFFSPKKNCRFADWRKGKVAFFFLGGWVGMKKKL